MKLTTKVNLTLCGVFLVGFLVAGLGAYKILTDEAIETSQRDARIIMEEASAVRAYTASSIYPQLEPQLRVQFLPQVVSAFAAQTNFRLVQKKLPEYSYREPALNPTNTNDRAADWEASIINDFRNNTDKTEMAEVRDTPIGKELILSRPLSVSAASCLGCHSTAEAAPATMVALYGAQNGFGWKPGEIVAAQIVSIPVSVPLQRAYHTLLILMGALAAVFLVTLLLVDWLLRALVIKPVMAMSRTASEVSMGNLDASEFTHPSGDEIGSLAASFNRMRRSLQNAIKILEEGV